QSHQRHEPFERAAESRGNEYPNRRERVPLRIAQCDCNEPAVEQGSVRRREDEAALVAALEEVRRSVPLDREAHPEAMRREPLDDLAGHDDPSKDITPHLEDSRGD